MLTRWEYLWSCKFGIPMAGSCSMEHKYLLIRAGNFDLMILFHRWQNLIFNSISVNYQNGVVLLPFHTSRNPFPVDTSTVIAVANPTIARRPNHTSSAPSAFVPCSHLMEKKAGLHPTLLLLDEVQKTAKSQTHESIASLYGSWIFVPSLIRWWWKLAILAS